MSSEPPLYVSKAHRLSWGQEYRIYQNRIELRTKILFCTLRIPLEKIVEIVVRPKPVWADLFHRPMETWWSYNNDWAGFARHVYLHRRGWPSRIRFVPEDPDAFVARCRELLEQLLRRRPVA